MWYEDRPYGDETTTSNDDTDEANGGDLYNEGYI